MRDRSSIDNEAALGAVPAATLTAKGGALHCSRGANDREK
jgi:hypothetical protein